MALDDLTNDNVALGIKPPTAPAPLDLGGALKNASEVQSNLAYANNANTEAQRHQYDLMSDQLGRAARDVMMQPDGQAKTDRWNYYVDQFYNAGYLNKFDHAQFYNNPSPLVLNQALAHSMPPAQYGEMTGQVAGAQAAARVPFEPPIEYDPAKRVLYPGAQAGAPGGTVGMVPGGLGAGAPGAAPGGSPAPGKATPGEVTPGEADADTKALFNNDPYYKEIPTMQVGQKMPGGPGVISAGIDPAAAQARDQGIKEFSEEISPQVAAASQLKGTLGTMRTAFQSGNVTSGRLQDFKQTVAGYMYGALTTAGETGDQAAKDTVKYTGINLPWSEIAGKETTRMGLSFSKNTLGAREALMSIRIALGANPSLMNTNAGNLKIIDIMDKGADYDIARGNGAQSYMRKQQDTTGVPHLVGFDNYWTAQHPASTFISKAVPYQTPLLRSGLPNIPELKNGVTYDVRGKIGVWDATRQKMDFPEQ